MKQTYLYLLDGKSVFFPSLFVGGISFATIQQFINLHTPEEIFGYSLAMWFVALVVNVCDIYTGVRADIAERKRKGTGFEFESDKGWKAFEKIFGFTMVIWMVYRLELESIRLGYSENIVTALNALKSIFFVYVLLIELKSIGRNNEIRFGKKGELFKMLDKVISVIDGGLMYRFKKLIYGTEKTTEDEKL